MKFTQCELSEGVRLHLCETDKFTSLTCKIFIQQDLKEKEATGTALLPLLLRRDREPFLPPCILPGSRRNFMRRSLVLTF